MKYSDLKFEEVTLQDIIDELKKQKDLDKVCKIGFDSAHSWRGIYGELAFEPEESVTKRQMLIEAESAVNKIFTGYKGGNFKMKLTTSVHYDYYGNWSDGDQAKKDILKFLPDIDLEGRTEEWLDYKIFDLIINQ